MLFLLVGGVFSQTDLKITGGVNWEASQNKAEASPKWTPTDEGNVSGIVYFKESRSPRYCRVGGKAWHENYSSGTQHTFTVTLNNSFVNQYDQTVSNLASGFILVAVKGGDYSNNELTDNNNNWNNNFFKTDGNGSSTLKVVASTEPQSTFTNNQLVLELTVEEDYDAVYLYAQDCNYKFIKIVSITRTVSAASSVGKPTITAPDTYDGESTAVTITPGANNHHVKYSVSGSSNDVSNVSIASETTIYITGTSDVTITAVGYNENESESNTETKIITYSNVVPSGIVTVWTGSTTFADGDDGWSTNVEINNSQFSSLDVGDYIFLKVSTPHGSIPNIGFRNNWSDDCKSYTDTKSGNVAYGNLPEGDDPYWWLKVTDSDLCGLFKNGTPRIQGQNFTLKEVQIHKHVDIGEGANTISKSTDMIVNLDRSFVAGTWNTVCLPFVPTSAQANELFGSGYQVAEFTGVGVSGTTMQFTTIDINDFEAGKPYLVMPKTGCASGTTVLFDVDITAKTPQTVTYGGYSFVGTFNPKTFSGGECSTSRFVATENELKTPNNNSTLKSLRCYFTVPAEVVGTRSLSFDVDEEGNTTGVADINRETITNNCSFFNLAGQRVAKPTKGLYIVNGKKVVIK